MRIALVAVWVIYVLLGHRYAQAWVSDETLWRYAAQQTPQYGLAIANAAVVAR